ncbi:metal-dependent hydrolase [Alkalihalobacillus sp. LMS39]|uniref:metal-dependent hydrolase n=1 Tax=Alkalihalobacillus sp. LMS39 TaxID=2924032 RepID=UPI001FB3E817|nr:metal-dependent hydrolase [Alkalihalobacillus sp. LMS39]UOE92494.1 metal-dependent hydrolase [Alkalihalobacillus sp. LMS39]
MDTVTHTLFGLTTYGAINKDKMDKPLRRSLLFSALVGSQIPDIDVVANLTETGRIMEQMWHRGLTHSYFMVPIWAVLIYLVCYMIWQRKDPIIFYLAFINVTIHNTSDALNAWGTGLFEPFFSTRVTLGVIPIVDLMIWFIMLLGFLIIKVKKEIPRFKVWRIVWVFICIHVSLQLVQGLVIQDQAQEQYEKVAISADFIPGSFTVLGKQEETVTIYKQRLGQEKKKVTVLSSNPEADLDLLYRENPKAEVLNEWSPFVVVFEDETTIGIFDPRFYRNGSSFLTESIHK